MMTDSDILAEIERRIAEHIALPGWSEEGAGFAIVTAWINEMRSAPPRLISIEYDGEGRERARFYRSAGRLDPDAILAEIAKEKAARP